MKVLLTGAFGNLGVSTIRELLNQGHRVRCFDIPSRLNKKAARQFKNKIDIIWGDIRDKETIEKAVADQEAVIHNAAVLPPITDRQPELARAINVDGTKFIIDAIETSSSKAIMVYSSSVTVHGTRKDNSTLLKVTEPVQQTDNYSGHKIECEKMLQESNIPWVILRIGVSVGPETRTDIVDSFKKLFELAPDTRLEYVSPGDVAMAQVNAVSRPLAVKKTFLIGGGKSCQVTYRELIGIIFRAMGIGKVPEAAFGDKTFYTDWMDTEEGQKILEYQTMPFEQYRENLFNSLRGIRLALFPIRPLVKYIILQFSIPWKTRKKNITA